MAIRYSSTFLSSLTNVFQQTGMSFNCKVQFYTGTQPATPDTASGTLLGTLVATGSSTTTGNKVQSSAWTPANAVAAGTVGYIRVLNSSNQPMFDLAVGSEVFITNPTYAIGDPLILSPILITI